MGLLSTYIELMAPIENMWFGRGQHLSNQSAVITDPLVFLDFTFLATGMDTNIFGLWSLGLGLWGDGGTLTGCFFPLQSLL